MKKSPWSKILSIVLILAMILAMFPPTSLSVLTETIGEPEFLSLIPDLDEVIQENSSEMAGIIASAQGEAPGYGSNGKFLAPIEPPATDAIPIYTAQDLDNVRNNLSGSYKLMNDIDLSGYNGDQWVPIGSKSGIYTFFGTFDGQGYVIKNLRITGSTYQYNGLFGYASGTIKNVGLVDTEINVSFTTIPVYTGGICGYSSGKSYYYSGTISNCYNAGEVTASSNAGGICGYNRDNSTISNCYNTGEITASSYAGGICGNNSSNNTISNCYNTGEVTASSYAGGICGNNGSTISNCYNAGEVTASSSSSAYAGGICGSSTERSTISNCYNAGEITASSSSSAYAGGICCYNFKNSTISNCYNTGEITASSYAGGICCYNFINSTISNCYNTGEITAFSYAGGICGNNSSDSTIRNCYNTGEITASSFAGGICGRNNEHSTISNCYNTGEVTASSSSLAYAGGICGYNDSNSTIISNCVTLAKRISAEAPTHYSCLISYTTTGSGGTKRDNLALEGDVDGDPVDDADRRITLVEAKDQATYEEELEWDFDDVWYKREGYAYPQLRGLPSTGLSTDTALASLTIMDVDESMLFLELDTTVSSHTVAVPYSIDKVIISAKANHSGASISGTGEQILPEVGEYSFNVKVIAEDGTTKSYTIAVTREPQPQLINLILSAGELDPVFDPDTPSYTVSVAGDVSSISFTAFVGGSNISIGFSEGGAYQDGNQWMSDLIALDTTEKQIAVYVYKDWSPQVSYSLTVKRDLPPTSGPIYKWEATGDIGTVGRVLFDIQNDLNFLDKYALVCDEYINAEIYFSPIRTDNAIAAGQNTYVFAVRLPNGETKKDINFSFKPIGGAVEKNKIIIYGDVNEDGSVSTTDATLVTRWAGGNTATVLGNILAADVNGDGSITTTDATLLTRRAGGNTSTAFSIEVKF